MDLVWPCTFARSAFHIFSYLICSHCETGLVSPTYRLFILFGRKSERNPPTIAAWHTKGLFIYLFNILSVWIAPSTIPPAILRAERAECVSKFGIEFVYVFAITITRVIFAISHTVLVNEKNNSQNSDLVVQPWLIPTRGTNRQSNKYFTYNMIHTHHSLNTEWNTVVIHRY